MLETSLYILTVCPWFSVPVEPHRPCRARKGIWIHWETINMCHVICEATFALALFPRLNCCFESACYRSCSCWSPTKIPQAAGTDRHTVDKSDLLHKEFGIDMKYDKVLWIYTLILWLHGRPQTVKKHRQELGLLSSWSTKRTMPEEEQRSHIASAIANDPWQWDGPHTIQCELAFQGIQLPQYVSLLKNCNIYHSRPSARSSMNHAGNGSRRFSKTASFSTKGYPNAPCVTWA